jgi:hypothetical protein
MNGLLTIPSFVPASGVLKACPANSMAVSSAPKPAIPDHQASDPGIPPRKHFS